MKSSRRTFLLIELILGVFVVLFIMLYVREQSTPNPERITLIVENSENNAWKSLRYGMKEAASDYGLTLSVASTGNFENISDINVAIEEELEDGTDAMILYPKYQETEEETYDKISIPTIAIGHGNMDAPTILPDYYNMGVALGEEVLRDYSGNLTDKTVGILVANWQDENYKECYQGLADTLEGSGHKLKWILGQDDLETTEIKLRDLPNAADLILALDNDNLELAAELSASRKLRGAIVYGIGYSSDAIYYLDTEVIRALIVPDYFKLGYLSVEEIAKKLEHPFYDMQDLTVNYKAIRQRDIFTEENQNILNSLDLD